MRARRFPAMLATPVAFAIGVGCATLANPGGGNSNLPNAVAGPFRLLKHGETGSQPAPYVVYSSNGHYRDPCGVDSDADPSTYGVELYVGTGADGAGAIARFVAPDGRVFPRQPAALLQASEAWEGGDIGQPAVVAVGDERWLWYAAKGGIGFARSTDRGATFTKLGAAVFTADGADAWEAGAAPGAPAVLRLPDGSLRMFYAAGGAIGEATSADGVRWSRLAGPSLAASGAPSAPPDDAGVGEPIDDVSVADPFAVRVVGEEGRVQVRVYYTAQNRLGKSAIGLAARFGDAGPLTRAVAAVLPATALSPHAASVVAFDAYALLYATQASDSSPNAFPAVAAAVAPATFSLLAPAVVDAGAEATVDAAAE